MERVMKPGYAYADEFEFGIELILDGIEVRHQREAGGGVAGFAYELAGEVGVGLVPGEVAADGGGARGEAPARQGLGGRGAHRDRRVVDLERRRADRGPQRRSPAP